MVRSIEICCSVRSQVSGLYCSANPCVLALKINLQRKSYIWLLSFLVRESWFRQSSKCRNFHLQWVLLNRYFNFSSRGGNTPGKFRWSCADCLPEILTSSICDYQPTVFKIQPSFITSRFRLKRLVPPCWRFYCYTFWQESLTTNHDDFYFERLMFKEEAHSTETYSVEKHQKNTLRDETCCVHFCLDWLTWHARHLDGLVECCRLVCTVFQTPR